MLGERRRGDQVTAQSIAGVSTPAGATVASTTRRAPAMADCVLDLGWPGLAPDMDYSLHHEDDVFHQLSRELELPLLMSSPSHHSSDEELMRDPSPLPSSLLEPFCCLGALDVDPMNWESDSFARLDALSDDIVCEIKDEIKVEPSSPTLFRSSPSPSPSSSSCESWSGGESSSDVKMTLETPPVTPPQQGEGSPPTSPGPGRTSESVLLVSPVKIVPFPSTGVTVKQNNTQKIIITSQGVNMKKRPNIQPKPSPVLTTAVPTVSVPKSTEESRTIVLSAQDFAALTQGKRPIKPVPKVRIQPLTPAQQKTVPVSVKWEPGARIPILKKGVVAPAPVVAALSAPPMAVSQESEVKAIKRQQRMIKNRESACLSRKKKKEYVTALETELLQVRQENVNLKQENACLRERLAQYEDVQTCKKPVFNIPSNTKKTTAVLVVLFMVSLNIGSFGNLLYSAPDLPAVQSRAPSYQSARHGRSLLWADVDKRGLPDISSSTVANRSAHPTCPMSINQTESIRLDSELRRWIGLDVEAVEGWLPSQSPAGFVGELLLSRPPARSVKPKKKRRVVRKPPVLTNEVELYGLRPHQYNYVPFFERIHRRDDTFYLVTFSGDHLLLPALAHNKTVRPKMSFVLPELALNGSSAEHFTMMQIDCEVTNTQVLQVRETDIPAHLRQRNHTARARPGRPPYRPYFVRPPFGSNGTGALFPAGPADP
ncbi:cyclic AMP-dependent transcription factor ATF-6 alpha [Bacillus rossius redtenbacheri]|uniref:cyclic AMP-dependent transcription factor ATF-6 alpha n=1 Tax=Bacillus rossius redtenbacheri TaxID=93214 RepID=UPI002FDE5795